MKKRVFIPLHKKKKFINPELKERIRIENAAARAYAKSISKPIDKDKEELGTMHFVYKRKLDLNDKGCYFLWSGGKIVYIGQSKCIMGRLARHNQELKKVFDDYTWKPFHGTLEQRLSYERKLIDFWKPKYNDKENPVKRKKRKSKSVYLSFGMTR